MFKHILLPTDGSPLCDHAIDQCIALAKTLGAKVSGVHVIPDFHATVPDFHAFDYGVKTVARTRDQYITDFSDEAQRHLDKISKAAENAGVPCDTLLLANDHPYEAIIAAAEKNGCDLITMTTHGRTGLKEFLAGSETRKVLNHTRIPVLVFH